MGQRQRLALLRHFESEANKKLEADPHGHFYSDSPSDEAVPLTENGRRQGAATARRLAALFPADDPLGSVYHGTFVRVVSSTCLIVPGLSSAVRVKPDARLDKRNYGRFWNMTRKGIQVLETAEWARLEHEGELDYRPPGGENYPDFLARIAAFSDEVLTGSEENLAVVGSSDSVLALRGLFEGWDTKTIWQRYEDGDFPNGHIVVYQRAGRHSAWRRCA